MELNSPERVTDLTADNPYARDHFGRPLVPAEILERMQKVTTEEAWGVLEGHDYKRQFEGGWHNLQPQRILVGRAVTCRFVPQRPDVHEVITDEGTRNARDGDHSCWVVDHLEAGDVLVVELFGKVAGGTAIGHTLGSAIARRTGGTGLVVDGGIRDMQHVAQLPISVFCRGVHPTGLAGVTLVEINGPVRIGDATVLPGDVVLGTPSGVIFVPPKLAAEVVEKSEQTRMRDYFGKTRIAAGVYTPGEVDRAWSEPMDLDYEGWRASVQPEDLDL
ncbi:MAG: RraA family protein [bacterium]|nr:RraA family protein [bacterium]